MISLQTEEFKELQSIKGIPFPGYIKFRQLIITGPPGVGKTTLIEKLGGWPEEGNLDISQNNWWRVKTLTFRPREIHLCLPFQGIKKALVVHEEEWLETAFSLDVDLSRIQIPPSKHRFLSLDWQAKYVFEFIIQSPKKIFKLRQKRQLLHTHPIDQNLTMEQVKRQVAIYRQVALHLHDCGLLVYLREDFEGTPRRIVTATKHTVDMAAPPSELGIFEKLKTIFVHRTNQTLVDLTEEIRLKGESVYLPHNGIPTQLVLGKDSAKLHVYPEHLAVSSKKPRKGAYLIFNPDHFFSEISGFLKLSKGESLVIGRNKKQDAFFQYPPSVSKRHLSVSHTKKGLFFKDLESDSGTYVSTLTDDKDINRIVHWRTKKLYRLKEIFGNPIQLLSSHAAFSLLEEVNEILSKEIYRPDNFHNQPGGVIMMPEEMTPIIVGDLHAQVDNLLKILSENTFLESLEQNKAYLLILGDAVHSEIDGEMEKMETSLLMMDLLFMLKTQFPRQVFYIRGNHDSFSKDLHKSGIPQGILWAQALLKYRGKRYYEEMERYYDQLAYVAIAKDFFACHASPPTRKVDLDMLKNIQEYKGLGEELILNRVKIPGYPTGYTQTAVKHFRSALELDLQIPFIVSHNPLSRKSSVWLKAGKIKRHHIIFSGMTHEVSIFTKIGERMVPLTFSTEPLQEWINNLPQEKQGEDSRQEKA